ncbi:unnamed protein product [Amoebophrya sp. A25]|nr:unnamed protein product [Amoebophrya sp. A25]|eukprot:GSA25T00004504001.1
MAFRSFSCPSGRLGGWLLVCLQVADWAVCSQARKAAVAVLPQDPFYPGENFKTIEDRGAEGEADDDHPKALVENCSSTIFKSCMSNVVQKSNAEDHGGEGGSCAQKVTTSSTKERKGLSPCCHEKALDVDGDVESPESGTTFDEGYQSTTPSNVMTINLDEIASPDVLPNGEDQMVISADVHGDTSKHQLHTTKQEGTETTDQLQISTCARDASHQHQAATPEMDDEVLKVKTTSTAKALELSDDDEEPPDDCRPTKKIDDSWLSSSRLKNIFRSRSMNANANADKSENHQNSAPLFPPPPASLLSRISNAEPLSDLRRRWKCGGKCGKCQNCKRQINIHTRSIPQTPSRLSAVLTRARQATSRRIVAPFTNYPLRSQYKSFAFCTMRMMPQERGYRRFMSPVLPQQRGSSGGLGSTVKMISGVPSALLMSGKTLFLQGQRALRAACTANRQPKNHRNISSTTTSSSSTSSSGAATLQNASPTCAVGESNRQTGRSCSMCLQRCKKRC